jgi:hypothetical protein
VAESGSLLRSCIRKSTVGSNPTLSAKDRDTRLDHVPIAQLDRALGCGPRGRRFESSWARYDAIRVGPGLAMLQVRRHSRRRVSLPRVAGPWQSNGEMREWSNRADSKSVEPRKWFRGFESHSLRLARMRTPSASSPLPVTGTRRDGRAAEGARLESVCTLAGTVGSNPTLSALVWLRAPFWLMSGLRYGQPRNSARTGR